MKLLLFLLPLTIYAGTLETNVYNALMSYDSLKQARDRADTEIKKAIGKDGLTYTALCYRLLKDNRVEVPIKYKQHKYLLEIYKYKFSISFLREF